MYGRVLWFDNNKGYGFLSCSDKTIEIKEDIFFHWTEIKTENAFKTLLCGQPVSFDLKEDDGRKCAVNIRPEEFVNEATGKPILLITMAQCKDLTLEKFQIAIGSKENRGVKYLWFNYQARMVIGMNVPPSEFTELELCDIQTHIWGDEGKQKLIETGDWLKYDILMV